MTKAQIYIESNTAVRDVHPANYDVISKHNALKALDIQKNEDEQFFRNFLLSVALRQSMGEQVDLENEFNQKFKNI